MTWSNYIINDISNRISSDRSFPQSLTLKSLSEFYNVSISPVRTAVRELIKRGVLRKENNGRIRLNNSRVLKSNKGLLKTPNPPKDYFETIASDLVVKTLKGKSIFLREEDISKTYKISRTCVRQIFSKLAGYGFIDHIPRKGWQLRAFTQKDLRDFLEIREVLELKALSLAYKKLDKKKLKKILDNNKLPRKNRNFKMDNSLHEYIIQTAQNRYIAEFFDHYGKYYNILFLWEDHDNASAVKAIKQHRKILNSLINENFSEARIELCDHIHNNHKILKSINPENLNKINKGP